MKPAGRPWAVLLGAGLLLCVLAGQLVRVARLDSANWDEAHHLYDGYRILTERDYRANAEVPPLVKMVAALPLLRMHPAVPSSAAGVQGEHAFRNGRLFVFGNGGDRVLLPARLMCTLFTPLLAGLVLAAGWRVFGAAAGLCALLLFVFDPLVLAHGSLISTDMASACFLFAAVLAFYRYISRPDAKWLLLTGLAAGLALVSKFTGVLVAPMLLLLAVAEGVRARSLRMGVRLLGRTVAALLGAWVVLWAFYGFRYAAAPGGLLLTPALGPYLASLPRPAEGAVLAVVARWHLLPEAYVWGLANTRHTEWEYTSYFFGRVWRHGPWQYFPAAFLIKSTLPLMVLLLLAGFALRGRRPQVRAMVFLLLPVLVYGAVVVSSHFDIGARHLMPVYPFLYVLAGGAAAALLQRGRVWGAVAGVLLLWQAVTTERVSPDFMTYGNELWGGPAEVRRYLSDSNVDWGEQLKTVRGYLQENHVEDCWFGYFPDGAVEPQDYGVPCRRLPTPSGLWWLNLPMQVPERVDGTVLLSESVLDGVESGDGVLNPYDAFHAVRPVAVLQGGVYVYRGSFPLRLASAWVAVRDSAEWVKAGRLGEARALAERAVQLAPESVRTEVQLADVLLAQGERGAAAARYQLAEGALERQRPDLQGEELRPRIAAGMKAAGGG